MTVPARDALAEALAIDEFILDLRRQSMRHTSGSMHAYDFTCGCELCKALPRIREIADIALAALRAGSGDSWLDRTPGINSDGTVSTRTMRETLAERAGSGDSDRPCDCEAPRCERDGCQDKPTVGSGDSEPPYLVVSEAQWPEIAAAIQTGADHPLAIDGVPIIVAAARPAGTEDAALAASSTATPQTQ